jgi:hypothetical protein
VKEIDDYVQQLVDSITPSQYELAMKREMCVRLEGIVRRVVPNAELKIMGGTANTFALKGCDVDVCILSVMELGISQLEKLATEFRRAGKLSIIRCAPVIHTKLCRTCNRTSSAYLCPPYQTSYQRARIINAYSSRNELGKHDWDTQNGAFSCVQQCRSPCAPIGAFCKALE